MTDTFWALFNGSLRLSGNKQHYIPRSVLRGFLTDHTGKTEKVVVYRRNGTTYVSAIADVAAERHFYSKPSLDGSRTLDDVITEYEDRLAGLLRDLRQRHVGDTVEAPRAAEVIAHLASRSANLRQVFAYGMRRLLSEAGEAFSQPGTFSKLMGLDQRGPNNRFRETIIDTFSKDPRFELLKALSIPQPALERILFIGAKEGTGELLSQLGPEFSKKLNHFIANLKSTTETGHNQALAKSLVSQKRQHSLEQLHWRIHAAPDAGAILPDCVALGVDANGNTQPYMMAGSELCGVLMPLTTNTLLVGYARDCEVLRLSEFNMHAAQCSHELFIAASTTPTLAALSPEIGLRSSSEIDRVVSKTLGEVLPTLAAPEPVKDDAPPTTSSFSYRVDWLDEVGDDEKKAVNDQVVAVVSEVSQFLALTRLSGVTFVSSNSISSSDAQVVPPSPQQSETVSQQTVQAACRATLVVVNGVTKVHIGMRRDYAQALLSDSPETFGLALHSLVSALAQVDTVERLDTAFPGYVTSQVSSGDYERYLNLAVYPMIMAYCSARASAGFGADALVEGVYRGDALQAFSAADTTISEAKLAFVGNNDAERLYFAGLQATAGVLAGCAALIGHRQQLGQEVLPVSDAITVELEKRGLRKWSNQLIDDLNSTWRRRAKWSSLDELYALNVHAERILFQAGIIAWPLTAGGTHVHAFGLPASVNN